MPTGDLVVVERAYTPDRGVVGARLRQISKDALKPGAALGGRLIADIGPALDPGQLRGGGLSPGPTRGPDPLRDLRRQLQPAAAHAAPDARTGLQLSWGVRRRTLPDHPGRFAGVNPAPSPPLAAGG